MREQNCKRMASMNVDRADMKLPESVDRVGTVAGLPKAIGYIDMYPPKDNSENKSERAPRRHAPNTGKRFADMSNEAEQAMVTPFDNKRQLTKGQLQPHREGMPIIPKCDQSMESQRCKLDLSN